MLYAFTCVRNKDLAEDLVAESFYKALSNLQKKLRTLSSVFESYQNTYLDYLEKAGEMWHCRDNI